ncbi:MAG: hypothetical protein K2X39_01615, partial [Silvanigrellaceae bacterium]|nr:hypothetical protein [Silvanigrellaceae bacterium]
TTGLFKFFFAILSIFYFSFAYSSVTLFDKAEEFFHKQNYSQALELYEQIAQSTFSEKQKAIAQCRAAVIYSSAQNTLKARQYLERSLASRDLPLFYFSMCEYALLQVFILRNELYDARDFISKKRTSFVNLDPLYRARYYGLSAEIAKRLNDHSLENQELKKLYDVMLKNGIKNIVLKILNNKILTLDEIKTRLEFVETLEQSNVPKTFLEDALLQKIQQQKYDEALTLLKLQGQNIKINFAEKFNYEINDKDFLEWLKIKIKHDEDKIFIVGVILFEDEKLLKYNKKICEAISAFLKTEIAKQSHIKVTVKTVPLLTPQDFAFSSAKLIFEEYVSAIVGLLTFEHAQAFDKVASLFSIPVFFLGHVDKKQEKSLHSTVNFFKMEKQKSGSYLSFLSKTLDKPDNTLLLERRVFDSLLLAAQYQKDKFKKHKKIFKAYLFEESWEIDGTRLLQGPAL